MIRVIIEVDQVGHDFKIERTDEYCVSDKKATQVVDALIADARASMYAALTAVPKRPDWS